MTEALTPNAMAPKEYGVLTEPATLTVRPRA